MEKGYRAESLTQRKVCLLIDDAADDREAFANALIIARNEFDVIMIDNAIDAIQKIRDGKIRPDLIFLDLDMRGVNGYQVLVYLKGQIRYQRIPVIVHSSTADPDEIKRTRKLGATCFFERPAFFPELCLRLTDLLADNTIVSRQPAS